MQAGARAAACGTRAEWVLPRPQLQQRGLRAHSQGSCDVRGVDVVHRRSDGSSAGVSRGAKQAGSYSCNVICNMLILRLWSARTSRAQRAASGEAARPTTRSAIYQQGEPPAANSPQDTRCANSQSPPCRCRSPHARPPPACTPFAVRQRLSAPAHSTRRGQIVCSRGGGLLLKKKNRVAMAAQKAQADVLLHLSPISAPAAGPFPPQISPEGIARVPTTQLGGPAPATEPPRGGLNKLQHQDRAPSPGRRGRFGGSQQSNKSRSQAVYRSRAD
jgi:hypothetical protein